MNNSAKERQEEPVLKETTATTTTTTTTNLFTNQETITPTLITHVDRNNKVKNEESSNNKHIYSPRNYITTQYYMIERYLANFVKGLGNRWIEKLEQIKKVLSQYSSSPIAIDFNLNIDSIDDDSFFSNPNESDLLLNTYTLKELEEYMVRFGIVEELKKRDYKDLEIIPDFSDPFVHRIQITDKKLNHQKNSSDDILMDLFIRRKEIYVSDIISQKSKEQEQVSIESIPNSGSNHNPRIDSRYLPHFIVEGNIYSWKEFKSTEKCTNLINYAIKATVIEWLCLQDVSREFSSIRPPLPGQYFPGLGIAKQTDLLLVYLATKQNRDCILNTPFRFYNAFMYQSREYFFIDPSVQAMFLSLLADLEPYITKFGLSPVSWAFEFGCVKYRDEKENINYVVKWEFHMQIRPISKRMTHYIKSKEYADSVKENLRPLNSFYIDWTGHPSLSHFCHIDVNEISSPIISPSSAPTSKTASE
ncbi:hypothetical protein CYY_003992 [Polysphondylium violaceum]|uniref:Uncharacterized protein n=1 Tax=Polysphondylium violaceum TaxID=133409 RepID=A0A8J4UTF3_9MYCE|nr:hypothetical protein CYY_003992 [Polysphondylium violaceum]